HARELDHLPSSVLDRIRFWGVDQDADSVNCCRSRFDPARTTFAVGSVRDIIAGRTAIPRSDVIYASGLFDYLEQRAGAVLVKRMFSALSVGGTVIIPNLTPENEEIAYMEAVMDWWMYYRTEADMRQLASAAGLDQPRARVATFSTSEGRVIWLQI